MAEIEVQNHKVSKTAILDFVLVEFVNSRDGYIVEFESSGVHINEKQIQPRILNSNKLSSKNNLQMKKPSSPKTSQ